MQIKIKFIINISFLLVNCYAHAASLMLQEQSVTSLGNAYAGTAAIAEDASTAYYNPAGLTNVTSQIQFGGVRVASNSVIFVSSAASNAGAVTARQQYTYSYNTTNIPTVHIAMPLNSRWAFGFSVVSPFCLNNNYTENSAVRYLSRLSRINTFDLAPSVAAVINKNLSLGLGVDFLHSKLDFNSDILLAEHGYINYTGQTWTLGAHVGIMYKLSSALRLGLVYHSVFTPRFGGTINALAHTGNLYAFNTIVALPDRLKYSLWQHYNNWELLADIEWVRWSRLQNINFVHNNGSYSREMLNYRDSYRIALGLNYFIAANVQLKMGFAFDKTPATEKWRNVRLLDADSYRFGLGVKLLLSRYLDMHIGYAYVDYEKMPISQYAPDGTEKQAGRGQQSLHGTYEHKSHTIGIQMTFNVL